VSGCIDKKIGDRLYAYEAGLLEDAAREQFELHLLECRHCHNLAVKFKDEARLIRQDPDLRRAVGDLAEKTASEPSWRSRYVRTAFAIAAVLVVLLLKPWQLEFRPTLEAIAAENRLAVLYFENLAQPDDPDRFGEIVSHLLTTDLSESDYVQVVSSQRLYDILSLMGQPDIGTIDKNLATDVAERAEARWMLTGSILQMEPALVLTGQLSEVATGDLVASHRIEGEAGESVFDLVDRLTVKIKNDLSLPEEALAEIDPPIADVTTHSTAAYRDYLEGMELYFKYYNREAGEKFLSAVENDSTFAMAYYYLAYLVNRDYAEKAVRHAEGASRKEKLYIASLQAASVRDAEGAIQQLRRIVELYPDEKQAWYRLGRYAFSQFRRDDAVKLFGRAIELDSAYKLSYNALVYTYQEMGEPELALSTLDQYIARAPDEANPYDTKGDIYAEYGHLEEAKDAYARAVSIKRDFSSYGALSKLGEMYLFSGQSDSAREIFQELASCEFKATRSRARTSLAQIPFYQGRFDEAIQVLNDGIAADRLEQATSGAAGDRSGKHGMLSAIADERGQIDEAIAEIYRAIEAHNQVYPDNRYAYYYTLARLLAANGEFDSARAVAAVMKPYLESRSINLSGYWYALGCTRLAEGDVEGAVVDLEKAKADSDVLYIDYMLARAYLEAGYIDKAIAELEVQIVNFGRWRIIFCNEAVRCHYYLGVAYERDGREDMAVEQYDTFLKLWAGADSNHTQIRDATERLARLRNQP
jgi:tetratricopeptide (TPR) repeat protein